MAEPLSFDAPFTVCGHIDARAQHAVTANKVVLAHGDRTWTYRQFRDESVRAAHFLLRRLGSIDDAHPGHVAILLENQLELASIFGGCAFGGLTLFGVNTGLRGDVLAGVLNQSRARVLVVDEKLFPEVDRIRKELRHLPAENIVVVPSAGGSVEPRSNFRTCLDSEVGPNSKSLDAPAVDVASDRNLMVIYTSGTTGLPKGINNNHMKLCMIGFAVSSQLGLTSDDVGYACMPMFHSNAIFVGFMPAFWVGGSVGIRERFSASQFVADIFRYGVTYWNYVGEPVHYVLSYIEKEYGGDEARIEAEITKNPKNMFRYAVGNGAAPPDIDRFMRWFGLEDMYELYGSTEAAISTFRRKGDPRGSVGEVVDENVKILDAGGKEAEPAQLGADGKLTNYERAVGEICRVAADTSLFQGYFDNEKANADKYRDGVYHSGDLGHIQIRDGKRYLFFDGRTDDWIRKDGENFSAGQVGRLISEHPDVALAVAYGVPCSVSDELVMAAIKLRAGAKFDPKTFFDWCETQVKTASMDRKWFPDFVRLVDDFEYTQTQKVLVRNLKKAHFDRKRAGNDPVYWRKRGDTAYKPLSEADYKALRAEFAEREKLDLLDR